MGDPEEDKAGNQPLYGRVPVPAAGLAGALPAGVLCPTKKLLCPPAFWSLHPNRYGNLFPFELCPLWGAVFRQVGEWIGHSRLAKSVADKSWNYLRGE